MKLYACCAWALATLSLTLSGCQIGPVDEKVPVASSNIVENVRKTLESFEKTGTTGSALPSLESDINGIKATDPAKGEALLEGYRSLQQANTPDKVKAAAKEMMSKL